MIPFSFSIKKHNAAKFRNKFLIKKSFHNNMRSKNDEKVLDLLLIKINFEA